MILMPKSVRGLLPPLYGQESMRDQAYAYVKFFTPDSSWTWYATEFDGEDEFFGLVDGFEREFGYFSLRELEAIRGPMGLPVERDKYWQPTTLAKIRERLDERGKAVLA